MAIEEIPLNDEEIVEENQENVEEIINNQEIQPEVSEEVEPTPKRRGRPPGAKNKAKSKPKPVPVVKRSTRRRPPTPEESEESEEEEYEPPQRPRRRQQQVDPNPMQTVAAEMLHMMQTQNQNRHQARVNKYASWFPQRYA